MAAFSGAVLDTFEDRLAMLWQRDGFEVTDAHGHARLLRLLLEHEGYAATRALLDRSGIRAIWNDVLAHGRASFLASWIKDFLRPPVLDVLGGDFTVLRALVASGLSASEVAGCERLSTYHVDWTSQPFPVYDFALGNSLPDGTFHSLLLSTVLHHEPDPTQLVECAAHSGARRWVVVENCVDESNSKEFHLFVDHFFNRCLNCFDVPCVEQHRTLAQWRDMLSVYGRVVVDETRTAVPGMPFPYSVLVVER